MQTSLDTTDQIDNQVIVPALESILLKGSDVKQTLDSAASQMDGLLTK